MSSVLLFSSSLWSLYCLLAVIIAYQFPSSLCLLVVLSRLRLILKFNLTKFSCSNRWHKLYQICESRLGHMRRTAANATNGWLYVPHQKDGSEIILRDMQCYDDSIINPLEIVFIFLLYDPFLDQGQPKLRNMQTTNCPCVITSCPYVM